jgi:hypothetical protein
MELFGFGYPPNSWQTQAINNNYNCVNAHINNGVTTLPEYTKLCEALCFYGNLAMLEHIHKRTGCELTLRVFYRAINGAGQNRLDCLQYLFDNAPTVVATNGVDISTYAAANQDLTILKYVYEKGCPFNEDTVADASYGDNLDCIKFILSHGGQLSTKAITHAVIHGSLIHLQYLHENGCPWHKDVCLRATDLSNTEILEYAISHGAPYNVKEMLHYIIKVSSLKYLHERLDVQITEMIVYQILYRTQKEHYLWHNQSRLEMFDYLASFGYWESTLCYDDITPILIERMAELRKRSKESDLEESDLEESDLEESDLEESDLEESDLEESDSNWIQKHRH